MSKRVSNCSYWNALYTGMYTYRWLWYLIHSNIVVFISLKVRRYVYYNITSKFILYTYYFEIIFYFCSYKLRLFFLLLSFFTLFALIKIIAMTQGLVRHHSFNFIKPAINQALPLYEYTEYIFDLLYLRGPRKVQFVLNRLCSF